MFESLREIYGQLSRVRDEIRDLRAKLCDSQDAEIADKLKQALAREQAILNKVIEGD